MNKQQQELRNQARLALFTAKSIQDSVKDVWKRRCSSQRKIQLTRFERTSTPNAVLPQSVSVGKAVDQLRKKAVKVTSRTVICDSCGFKHEGNKLGSCRAGYRYPKAGARSVKIVKRADLLKAGFSESQVDSLIKMQGDRIRVKRGEILTRLVDPSPELCASIVKIENILTSKEINNTLAVQLEEIATV